MGKPSHKTGTSAGKNAQRGMQSKKVRGKGRQQVVHVHVNDYAGKERVASDRSKYAAKQRSDPNARLQAGEVQRYAAQHKVPLAVAEKEAEKRAVLGHSLSASVLDVLRGQLGKAIEDTALRNLARRRGGGTFGHSAFRVSSNLSGEVSAIRGATRSEIKEIMLRSGCSEEDATRRVIQRLRDDLI